MRLTPMVLIVLGGCSGPEGATGGPLVRDSAGIRIVENPAEDPVTVWQVTEQPLLDIGGTEAQQLFRVVSAVRLSDGRVVIGNRGTSDVRYYDADGTLLVTTGREGEGPGEFRGISWLGRRAADSVIVYDLDLLRLSVLDSTGAFARAFQLETTDAVPFAYVIGTYRGGSLLAGGFSDTGGETPDGLQRYDSPIYWFGANGELLANLGLFPGTETYYSAFPNGGFTVLPALFGRRTTRMAGTEHLYLGANDTYQLEQYTPGGTLTALIRRDHRPVSVGPQHIDMERERRLTAASGNQRDRIRETFDDIPVPETFPAYHLIRGDDDGNVWVQDYPFPLPTSARWTVFDATGIMQATVELPAGFEPTHIGDDFIVGTWEDELDVEHVRVYGLQRSS